MTKSRMPVSYLCWCNKCGHTGSAHEFGQAGGKCPRCGSQDFGEQL